MLVHGDPNIALPYVLIIVTIDIPGCRNVNPRNFGVPLLHRGGKPARGFGDDFKCARHRVNDKLVVAETLVIKAFNEGAGERDVIAYVKKVRLWW